MEDDSLLQRVFYVYDDGEELDLNIPPTSGNEYLRRVQLEAKQCPVVKAEIDTSRFLSNQTVTVNGSNGCLPAPKGFAPSKFWQQKQVADFSEVRQKLSKYKKNLAERNVKLKAALPKLDDDIGWCQLCFGGQASNVQQVDDDSANISNLDDDKSPATFPKENGVPPSLSIVCAMSQLLIEQVLNYHISWLEVTGFTPQQGRWFYALLACLEKPLTPEACSSLRSLARVCCKLRANLTSCEDPILAALNLLICLVANYFDQRDLADDP